MNLSPFKKYLFVSLLIVFFLSLHPATDIDLGWHLRYGQYFFETGKVLKENIISYISPNYHWIENSWGYDVVLYQIFNKFGFIFLTITVGLICTSIFFIATSSLRKMAHWLIPLSILFLFLTFIIFVEGLRAQTVSALFFALVILCFKKKPILLPVLTLLWANFHGAFILGLIVVLLAWLGEIISNNNSRKLTICVLLSLLTPLLNPWGFELYLEAAKPFNNQALNSVLTPEWLPLLQVAPISVTVTFFATAVFLVYLFKANWLKNLSLFIPLVILFALTLISVRIIALFGILSIFFLSENISYITWRQNERKIWLGTTIALLVLVFYSLKLSPDPIFNIASPGEEYNSWKSYCHLTEACSETITLAMAKNPKKGHGYHPLFYGGYLSWRVQNIKTFVDGRMTTWGTMPLTEDLLTFKKYDQKYNFKWAIVTTNGSVDRYLDVMSRGKIWQKELSAEGYTYYIKTD